MRGRTSCTAPVREGAKILDRVPSGRNAPALCAAPPRENITMKKKPGSVTKKKAKTKSAPPSRPVAKSGKSSKKVQEDVHKFEAAKPRKTRKPATRTRPAAKSDIDQLGDLPQSYGEERIFVVAQEPHWLFCYWDYTLTEGVKGPILLRHSRAGSARPEAEVPVPAETNSWYLSVRDADADYFVELGHYHDGVWKTLVRSSTVMTPRDSVAGLGQPIFANMPFHLTFQQLVEKLRGEMREGESLAETLARLQSRDDMPFGHLTATQRVALDRLLDTELGSLTSGQLASYFGSPGASLFSGGFARSSWSAASWGAAAASWEEAPGGFSSGFLAEFGLAGASWSGASFFGASWEQAISSWSFGVLGELGVSSGGASWGPSASWMSSWHGPRGFFMHVNAEVIFYGGTHPDAKVTIDGREITLSADGSFRYHFVLPDGEFEIPIVATSPDGVETRRAVLRFERATSREGDVGSTGQPPLGEPMGRKKA